MVEFCNASTHNQEAPNPQNQMCSLRSVWDVITDSDDFSNSLPMSGTELPPPPTFSLVQAGDRVVCLVLDVSSKMAEVTSEPKWLSTIHPFSLSVFNFFSFQRIRAGKGEGKCLEYLWASSLLADERNRFRMWPRNWDNADKKNAQVISNPYFC